VYVTPSKINSRKMPQKVKITGTKKRGLKIEPTKVRSQLKKSCQVVGSVPLVLVPNPIEVTPPRPITPPPPPVIEQEVGFMDPIELNHPPHDPLEMAPVLLPQGIEFEEVRALRRKFLKSLAFYRKFLDATTPQGCDETVSVNLKLYLIKFNSISFDGIHLKLIQTNVDGVNYEFDALSGLIQNSDSSKPMYIVQWK